MGSTAPRFERRTRPAPACNLLPPASIDRGGLAEDYLAVRAATEALARDLSPEDQNLQSMPGASPVKWHRAHTTWFFEVFLLEPHGADFSPSDPAWRYLFNSYYNAAGAQYPRPQRGLISRPSVEEVADYRRRVDEAVLDLVETAEESEWPAIAERLRLGLNHEQQHQELIVTDLKHALALNPLLPAWTAPPAESRQPAAAIDWIAFDARIADIGTESDGRFHFDNERPRHREVVESFELASRPVTCGEFLAFIEDRGYDNPALWLSDGWTWLEDSGTRAPLYWRRDDDGCWQQYSLGGLRPVDEAEALAHISFYEAFAFAHWAGARLPTEAEWEVAAAAADAGEGPFADAGRFHPAATEPADAGSPAGMFGNVWEWTASAYAPYPGFQAAPGAVGEYNGKFMANQMVLRGGSCATPAGHIRATYRNFFYPPDRWQFSGLRLARKR